ncbi:MAG: galactokinase, partial [Clostridiales bacterium]|nr:galactokinase [Candidatus Coliplasma caballi]
VPKEMKAVAAALGKDFLRDCTAEALYDNLPTVRKEVGDRAILRAIHFFDENERVEAQKKALEAGDAEAFFAGVRKSGKSSFEFLQNVYSSKNVSEQGLSLALALTERFDAICRVHGGGFAGTIQAYVPKKNAEAYKARIDGVFGDGACMMLHIRPVGATKITPEK